ncbi:hypothetical protein LQV05_005564 [Cryptococcus neoformans]|nr:hypothetical protein LQV05_005564 [Cryptococcus neoformans]
MPPSQLSELSSRHTIQNLISEMPVEEFDPVRTPAGFGPSMLPTKRPSLQPLREVKTHQNGQVKEPHRPQPEQEGNKIQRPKTNKYHSLKGVDPKFRRNARYAAQGSAKAIREAKASA